MLSVPTGIWPASIGPLGHEQLKRIAATQPFVDAGVDALSLRDLDDYVATACGSGDRVARALLYRAIERRNGRPG